MKITYFASVFLCKEVIAATCSPLSISINILMLIPLDVLVPSGILSTNILYILPFVVKIKRLSTVLVVIGSKVISSSDLIPFPFLFCTLNESALTLFTSPFFVIITTHFSGSGKFSSSLSSSVIVIIFVL